MVKAQLVSAMDFRKRKGDVTHTTTTRKVGEQWYVDQCGPTYANCFKVTEFDEEGLRLLEKYRVQEEP
jgi:hypothetical protein